ncbi:MAG: hypothetical protein WC724_02735 [Candidatus Paceibacterota bacterium]|jgi:vacuolar-type H+-ATPase subunit H
MNKKIISVLAFSLVFVSVAFAEETTAVPAVTSVSAVSTTQPSETPDSIKAKQAAFEELKRAQEAKREALKKQQENARETFKDAQENAREQAKDSRQNIRTILGTSSPSQATKEELERIREARKDAYENAREAKKDAYENAKEAFEKAREQAKGVHDGIKNIREGLKKATSTVARKEANNNLAEKRVELSRGYFETRINSLNARIEAITRAESTLERVLVNFEKNGINTTDARALFSVAQSKIDIATQKVTSTKTLASSLSGTVTKESIKSATEQLKKSADEAGNAIEETRKDLSINVIPAVRKLSPQKQSAPVATTTSATATTTQTQ